MNSLNLKSNINIVIAGVGGQGSITAGHIATRAASLAGLGVTMSEVHGMAQRGGSVMSTVRYGDVHSPVVSKGEVDFLLGFEKLEALRFAPWLRPGGIAIVSDQRIIPTVQALKQISYPTEIDAEIRQYARMTVLLPALKIAEQIGNPRLVGSVILGAFSAFLEITSICWEQALGEIVPPHTISVNLRAFEAGHAFACDTQTRIDVPAENETGTEDGSYFVTA